MANRKPLVFIGGEIAQLPDGDTSTPSGTAGGVLSGQFPNPGFAEPMATQAELDAHALSTANPHGTTKAQVGLGSVDNTSDVNKPVSTAQAAADLAATNTAKLYTDSLIANGIKFPDGSVAAPGIAFTGDTDTGIRRTGANAVAIVTGGVDRFTVGSAGAITVLSDVAGATANYYLNPNAAVNAASAVYVGNTASPSAASALGFAALGAGFTAIGAYRQSGSTLDAGSSLTGGLSIISQAAQATAGIRFYTGGYGDAQLRMTISNTGKVGVGSDFFGITQFDVTPAYSAGAVVDAAFFCQSSVVNPTMGQGVRVHFGSSVNLGRTAAIEATVSSGLNGHHLAFLTNIAGAAAVERARITAEGYVGIGVVPSARNNTILQILDGIGFPAAQVPSSDPNTQDDYEEGTFIPTITGATTAGVGTYSVQTGRYTKVGNRVFYTINLVWSAHTGTGSMRVSGLAFVSANKTNNVDIPSILGVNLTYTNQLGCFVQANSTQIPIYTYAPGTTETALAIDTAGAVYISGHYDV